MVNYAANKEAGALAAIFGDYVVGAWYSRNRALREAALSKMNLDLNNGAHDALLTLNMVSFTFCTIFIYIIVISFY